MNKIRRFLAGKVGLVLSLILVSAAVLSACDTAEKEESAITNVTSSIMENSSQNKTSNSQADKTETVYVKADASGNVREITVEELLRNPELTTSDANESTSSSFIEDYSTLQDIKNTKGDEEFTDQGDGTILWENHGEDIHYKGTSQDELPVSVKISYFLDGKEIRAEDLAGKSGEVRIRFDYENHTTKSVKIDGKQVQVKVPFAVLSAMVLPSDIFSNIEVSGGKQITMDEQNVVIGFAYPGLEESLQLSDYEPTKDISLPDFLEITAQVSNFELDFTATVITTGTFSDLDLSDLDDVNTLIEDMSELTDASSELVDGTAELFKGADTFKSYLKEYVQGVDAVNEGAAALTSGLNTLNIEKEQLAAGAAALQSGLEQLNAALAQFSFSSSDSSDSNITGSEPLVHSDAISALTAAGNALSSDAQTLASELSALQESLNQIQNSVSDAAIYTTTVQSTITSVNNDLFAALEALEEIETNANNTARQQAKAAAEQALEDTNLSEEEKAALLESIENSISISGVTEQAQRHITTAISQLTDLPVLAIPELSIDFSPILETVYDMQTQMRVMSDYSSTLSGMTKQLSVLQGALDTLKDGAAQLQDGSTQLTDGMTAFNQGIAQLYDGSVQLGSGTKALSSAGSSLADGFDTLAEGLKTLKDGIAAFDEEGIQSLGDLAGDDLAAIVSRVKALKEADCEYDNFAGIKEGQTGSVRFIIETDAITAD